MATINVTKPFTLLLDDGTTRRFEVGGHDVTDDIAGHWWSGEHSAPALEAEAALPAGEADGREALLARAAELGVKVDGRWSNERIAAAIAEAEVA
ncbi:STY1053 family phage-associated protein [Pseudochelatococcus contaminans]|uniref:Uncharacterized protein n=1 Tax=Pseudochelatococcus contaminans TaxID=1538103 RepID=A0A7W6EFC2_9HYPH|nr:hypothetical protein [Pseudochelatococcus contaminans]MBB3808759.1 hypothetical protein [Pseudochelatococcus contaminans]